MNNLIFQRMLPYFKIARFDHWFKNIFMVPGIIVALYLDRSLNFGSVLWPMLVGILATGFVASSNYVINEILDAKFDRLHPVKKNRPVPSGQVNLVLGYIEWIVLAIIGLGLAYSINHEFFYCALLLWIMGCFYNIPPVRTKDKPFIDVLSESVNNPLRLLLGWYLTGTELFAPLSLIMAYWMIGAFFMAIKRYAEYQRIGNKDTASSYRASFRFYNPQRLMISIMYYVAAFGLFFGIFLIRYRIELILSIPFIAGFVAWYMHLAYLEDSPVQYPEKLYKERGFVIYTGLCFVIVITLLLVDVPVIEKLFPQTGGSLQGI